MQPLPDEFMEFHPVHGSNVRLDFSGTQATRVESFANGVCFSKRPLKPGEIFLIEIEDKELGWCGHLRVGLTARDPGSLDAVPEYSIPDLTDSGDSWVFAITRNHNKIAEDPVEAADGGAAGGHRLGRGEAGEGDGGADNSKPKTFFTDSHLDIDDVRIPLDKLVGRSRPGRYSHILDDLYKTNALPPTARRSRIGVLYVAKGRDLADMHIVINGEDMGASAKGIPSVQPLHAVVDVFAATNLVPADVVQEIHPEAHRPQDGHRLAGAARGPEALLQVRMRSTEQDAPMLVIQVSQGDNNKLTSWLVGLFV
uniref:Neuralized E3 ubiquitin protein ligase 2 n=1 Tax=Gasterosteus aculeatus aculeatus TaxID=481459 RepID=A0AAQ4QME3_GASAC